jgi:hypothetical protein
MFGRMLGPVGTALTYGYDSLFGTSDEELGRLKAFDEAKDILKQQGLTDKDIGSLSTEDIFGAAQAFGYKGQRGVPVAQATKGITDAEKALAAQAGQIEAGKGPNAQMGIAALEGSPQSGRVPGLSPQTVAGLDALGTDEASATVGALAKQVRGMRESLAKPSLEATDKEVDEMYKKAGVSLDPYAQYKKDLEAEGKSDAEARKEAGWMRALEAGLGIMGGESPYAFTNIGKGAQAGLKGYGEDIKEFRKAAKDRTKAMADIAAAENSLKKGITDAKIQRYDRAKERYDSASMKLYEIDATLSMEKAKLSVAKGAKVTEVALKEANDQIQKEMAMNPTLAQDPTAYQARLDQLYRGFVSALQGGGVTTGSGVPAGVKVTKK